MTRARFECPQCGALFRAGRLACPECGSDAETGWKDAEEIDYQAVDLPDGVPDDAELFGKRGRPLWVVVVAILVLLGLAGLLRVLWSVVR